VEALTMALLLLAMVLAMFWAIFHNTPRAPRD
jgi:hypothetical protein